MELQDLYEDDLSRYTSDDMKAAISELHNLGKKGVYGKVDIDSLTAECRHIIKTRWVIRPRPSSTSVDDIGDTAGFVAKGYTHRRPRQADIRSNTSKYIPQNILLYAMLHQYQVTSCDVSSAFLNTPIEEDIFSQPPPEVYQHRPQVVWKLHRALYGLRPSLKM